MYNDRFTIKKTVSDCCESTYYYGDDYFICGNCNKECERTTLIYMTHENVGKGTWRPLSEPTLVADYIFNKL